MHLAIPSIWTPPDPSRSRLAPWWNLKRRLDSMLDFFTTNHLVKGATGHLMKNTAGHLVNQCPNPDCLACPNTLTLTISGATMCTECIDRGSNGSGQYVSGTINGSWVLTRVGGNPTQNCIWTTQIFGTGVSGILYNPSRTCSGTPSPFTDIGFTLTRDVSVNTWTVQGFVSSFSLSFFFNGTAGTFCSGGPVANAITSCGTTAPNEFWAVGGTASWS